MSSGEHHINTHGLDIGLDRAEIDLRGRIQLHPTEKTPTTVDREAQPDSSTLHHLLGTFKSKTHHAAIEIRKTLNISKVSDNIELENRVILAHDADEHSNIRLVHNIPGPDKTTFKDALHNPINRIVSRVSGQGNKQVAAQIATKEIPHGQEVDMVKTFSKLKGARTEKEKLLAIDDLNKLIKERQSALARWTLDRHVTKVRLMPQETIEKPKQANFQKHMPDEGLVIDWAGYARKLLLYYTQVYGGQYVGYGSDPPTPSKETIMPNVERLLIASAPLQEFIMTTRRVYRYESPAETLKYLLIYCTLWYFNLILPGLISALLYFVIERHVHGTTVDDLRKDIVQRENSQETALTLAELIIKKGEQQWADDLLKRAGPWMMVQLVDHANFFETVRNFYEWRVPHRTLFTLILLGLLVPITAFAPIRLLVKSGTLAIGFVFFALYPIATNFPEYRLLVSPSKRFLWNIPTHAEWAIKYIQAKGSSIEETTLTSHPDYGLECGSYSACEGKVFGRLIVQPDSLRYVSNMSATYWALPFAEIERIEKQDRILSKNVPSKLQRDSGKDLLFVTRSGEEKLLKDVGERDEVFSQVLGFSKSSWQVVW